MSTSYTTRALCALLIAAFAFASAAEAQVNKVPIKEGPTIPEVPPPVPPPAPTPTWTERSPNEHVVADVGPGFYYVNGNELFVRQNQQSVLFYPGGLVGLRWRVRVNGGDWLDVESRAFSFLWESVPTELGAHQVEFEWYSLNSVNRWNYTLYVLPPAHKRFTDVDGNSIVLWRGGGSDRDRVMLVSEGIDANNQSYQNAYYALGLNLFETGRAQGGDIAILNYADGGASLYENAEVLKDAVRLFRDRKASGGRFDVAGVSMGGVLARMALAGMEEANEAHDATVFLSMDAPHTGAVVERGLADFIDRWDAFATPPKNFTSDAGRQMLRYNPYASSGEHTRFYTDIDDTNGDGYPHLTTNVGAAFSTPAANVFSGQEWLSVEFDIFGVGFYSYDSDVTGDVALAGSYLPQSFTRQWGSSIGGAVDHEIVLRSAKATFMPYESALHIVNGQSRFDVAISANRAYDHDEIPPEVAIDVLEALGYNASGAYPAPTVSRISGPSCVRTGYRANFTAYTSGGVGPFRYKWQYQPSCGLNAKDGESKMGPSCTSWNSAGSNRTASISTTSIPTGPVKVRVRVTDDLGRTSGWRQTTFDHVRDNGPDSCGGGFPDDPPFFTDGEASGVPAPEALELPSVFPNPVHGEATVRVGVPESAEVQVQVVDMLGRTAAETTRTLDTGWHEVALATGELPAGSYVVVVRSGTERLTQPITVVR